MPQGDSIRMVKAILHILDNSIQIPVISTNEIESDEDVFDFIGSHIAKVVNSDKVKIGTFIIEDNPAYKLVRRLSPDISDFVGITGELANNIFDIMKEHVNIPPGDVIFCIFESGGTRHLAIIKFSYKQSYIHYVQNTSEGNINKLIKQTVTLPRDGQKIEECVIINLDSYEIRLLEREYEINGVKELYLSKLFLNCNCDLSNDDKFKIINKVTQKVIKKHFDEDFKKTAKLQIALADNIEENEEIKIDDIAHEVFKGNYEIQNEFINEVRNVGLSENTVSIQPSNAIIKKLKTHKLKTDSGIEISLPAEFYDNTEVVEFINNPDGTISILLKNISRISNK